jgi:hypothetical protein
MEMAAPREWRSISGFKWACYTRIPFAPIFLCYLRMSGISFFNVLLTQRLAVSESVAFAAPRSRG